MPKYALGAIVAMLAAEGASAQQVGPAGHELTPPSSIDAPVLPANTEVMVSLNEELNSKTAREGKIFDVSVSRDVVSGGRIVIPRGTYGRGEVVHRTGRGAFGKSGKMEIKLHSVLLGGRAVPIGGRFRQEGKGNTGATIGAVLAAGVVAGVFVTGHSAVFEQGREFRGYTLEAIETGARQAAAAMPAVMTHQIVTVRPAMVATVAPIAAVAPPAMLAMPRPIMAISAPVAPMPRRGYVVAEVSAPTAHDKALAAQRNLRGRQPQGWTISD